MRFNLRWQLRKNGVEISVAFYILSVTFDAIATLTYGYSMKMVDFPCLLSL